MTLSLLAQCFTVLSGLMWVRPALAADPSFEPQAQAVFLYRLSQQGGSSVASTLPDGFQLQGAFLGGEGRAGSDFFRFNGLLGIERATGSLAQYDAVLDQLFVDMGPIRKFTLRVGKYRLRFGTLNEDRSNQLDFIDRPLIYQEAFGSALNELAFSFFLRSAIFPWDSEFSEQFFTPTNTRLFGGTSNATNVGGVFGWRHRFPLSSTSLLTVVLGSVYGTNAFGAGSHVYNAGASLRSGGFKLAADYLYVFRKGAATEERIGGITTYAMFEVAPRWWLQGRLDFVGFPMPDTGPRRGISALIAHAPNPKAAVRLQYDYLTYTAEIQHRAQLQLTVGLGGEAAHRYPEAAEPLEGLRQ